MFPNNISYFSTYCRWSQLPAPSEINRTGNNDQDKKKDPKVIPRTIHINTTMRYFLSCIVVSMFFMRVQGNNDTKPEHPVALGLWYDNNYISHMFSHYFFFKLMCVFSFIFMCHKTILDVFTDIQKYLNWQGFHFILISFGYVFLLLDGMVQSAYLIQQATIPNYLRVFAAMFSILFLNAQLMFSAKMIGVMHQISKLHRDKQQRWIIFYQSWTVTGTLVYVLVFALYCADILVYPEISPTNIVNCGESILIFALLFLNRMTYPSVYKLIPGYKKITFMMIALIIIFASYLGSSILAYYGQVYVLFYVVLFKIQTFFQLIINILIMNYRNQASKTSLETVEE